MCRPAACYTRPLLWEASNTGSERRQLGGLLVDASRSEVAEVHSNMHSFFYFRMYTVLPSSFPHLLAARDL